MKALEINGHNGERYIVNCHGRPGSFEKYANLIRVEGNGLRYTGPSFGLTFVINGISRIVKVENSYEWDGASIPKRFQWLIGKPTDKEFRFASMLHDDGYEERSNRAINDVIFLYVLLEMGVPNWKADLMYKAVRAGGHAYYASDTSRFWRFIRKLL